ncbi:hypothetical protein BpHYR1_044558 [Brachionus plicatilis]|uniref:Uncharacterized protein n=1 Tax=Brachionus plicatilis TaxID=10195 RepID=A0A3M7R139_BRAPC|nr:hypothetical protein BpHYR1_044558 [Brachionus plicatilis]
MANNFISFYHKRCICADLCLFPLSLSKVPFRSIVNFELKHVLLIVATDSSFVLILILKNSAKLTKFTKNKHKLNKTSEI